MNHWHLRGLISAPLLLSCGSIIQGDPGTQPPLSWTSGGTAGGPAGSAGATVPAAGGGGSGVAAGASSLGGAGSSGGAGGPGGDSSAGSAPLGSGPLCDVERLLLRECVSCHSNPPALRSVPMSIVSYDDLVAPSKSDPAKQVAALSLERMQDAQSPMPPAPATPASAADIATLQAWIDAGMPPACDDPAVGAAGAAGSGSVENPYDTPTVCTSDQHWTRGDAESPNMHPGGACIDCHTNDGEEEGPRFTFAGTVYPSAHEPTDCNGVDGSGAGAEVVVIDANGATLTLKVNSVGNFSYEAHGASVALPYRAKVVQDGRERVMTAEQNSGDCNACHTETGAKDAPGRIMAP